MNDEAVCRTAPATPGLLNIATQHQSYLQDTPHLLRMLEKINQCTTLPSNAMLVTTDAIGLYLNIPHTGRW